MNDLRALIRTRRSVAKVRPDAVDPAIIRDLIDLATAAPNHHMHQPWRFIVVRGAARARIGAAHASAYSASHPDAGAEVLTREAARFERAPVVIACVVRPAADDAITRREDRDAVAAAVQNLLLGAHAHGLGATWRTGAMADERPVRSALGLDAREDIVAFVYLGVPALDPPPRPRRSVDEVTQWLDR